MKSAVAPKSLSFSVALGADGLDLEDLRQKLSSIPGQESIHWVPSQTLTLVFAVPTGTNLAAYEKAKCRQITDIVAAAERRAQRRAEDARRKAESKKEKPSPDVPVHPGT